jgi:hypothetical protein
VVSAALAGSLCAAEPGSSNASPGEILLLDNLGRVVNVPTNTLPARLLPPGRQGLNRQIPDLLEGADRAVFLEYRGYRNIFIMPEGYSGWVKRGYPLETTRR